MGYSGIGVLVHLDTVSPGSSPVGRYNSNTNLGQVTLLVYSIHPGVKMGT